MNKIPFIEAVEDIFTNLDDEELVNAAEALKSLIDSLVEFEFNIKRG